MKYYIITICLLFNSALLSGQTYCATYSHIYIMDDVHESVGCLTFDTQNWIYEIISSDEESTKTKDENSIELMAIEGTLVYNYRSLTENISLDTEYLIIERNVIEDPLALPDWEILQDSVSYIGDYSCYKARAKVGGRWFNVWFAPEIAVKAGPWKLWGLPGLIVRAESEDHILSFTLQSFIQCDKELSKPIEKTTISKSDFKKKLKEKTNKLSRYLNSFDSGSRNLEISGGIQINCMDKSLLEE